MISFRRRLIWSLAFCIQWSCAQCAIGEDSLWLAGFARERITPEQAMWMSGYASRDRPAEGTRTDLWAKAMALQDSQGNRAVLITLDLVGIDRDLSLAIRNRIIADHELDAGGVILNCSHTHTGPVVGTNLITMYDLSPEEEKRIEDYAESLKSKIISIAGLAFERLQPAFLSWSEGHATFAVNRRNNPEPLVPAMRSQGKLRGPVDYSVPVLRVDDEQRRLMGVAFGYACHATVLSDYQWSGDYPGYAQIELESRHPGVFAMFWAGCGSDVNPIPRRKPELAADYGKRLASAVQEVLDGVTTPIEPAFQSSYAEANIPFETLPGLEEWETDAKSENRYIAARARKWLEWLEAGKKTPASYPYPIAQWKLGDDVRWIFLGGEVVVDYALRLKNSISGAAWVAGYSNDVMAYIPSKRVWTEGGYEGGGAMVYYGLPSRWDESVEDIVFDAIETRLEIPFKGKPE